MLGRGAVSVLVGWPFVWTMPSLQCLDLILRVGDFGKFRDNLHFTLRFVIGS